MELVKDLFSSDVGLLSIAVLAFIVAMAVFFLRFFLRNMREDEAKARQQG